MEYHREVIIRLMSQRDFHIKGGCTKVLFVIGKQNNHKKIKKISSLQTRQDKNNKPVVFGQRASLSVPLCFWKGSMTVEAALVMPIFLFAVMALLYFFCIMSFQNDLQINMENTSRKVSTLKYASDNLIFDGENEKIKAGITTAYVYEKVLSSGMRKRVENSSSVVGGALGLSILRSDFSCEDECMDIVFDYLWKIPIYNKNLYFTQRCYFIPWTGRSINIKEKNDTSRKVYITKTGKVYHNSRQCTYLNISIKKVVYSDIHNLRNQSGAKYKSCEKCAKEKPGKNQAVYITLFGDRYHLNKECSTLQRYIQEIDISRVGDRKLCTKCG